MKSKQVKSEWVLVVVHWRDAFDGENGWTDLEKYTPEDTTVVTAGWLIPEILDGYITLVNSYFPDEVDDPKTVGMPIHIPTGMVIKTVILEQPTVAIQDSSDSLQESASLQKPFSLAEDYPPYPGRFQDATSRPNHRRE